MIYSMVPFAVTLSDH